MKSNCLIIAGEKSGEEHGLSFFSRLKELCPDTHFWGVGGDSLQKQGLELLYHLKDFSSFGFSEVIFKIPFYIKASKIIEQEAEIRKCRVAILIDYQGFNLRLAKRLKKKNINVLYYVAPQAWAWKPKRAQILERTVHTLFTIIPFEKEWFRKRGVKRIQGVAHPLLVTYRDALEHCDSKLGISDKPFTSLKSNLKLLLLPGSRNFEVEGLLPDFIQVFKELSQILNIELAIVKSPNVHENLYKPYLDHFDEIFCSEDLASALSWAHLAIAASGTVTLATALFQVPTVVCYKTSLLNEFIFRTFIKYEKDISLANIVHEKTVFPELVQEQVSSYNIIKSMTPWLMDSLEYEKIKEVLATTRTLLQGDSTSVAETISRVINEHNNNDENI